MGNGKSIEVEAIEASRLLLRTSFYLDLNETFEVLSFRGILVSISALGKLEYCCLIGIPSLVSFKIQIWLVLVLYHDIIINI